MDPSPFKPFNNRYYLDMNCKGYKSPFDMHKLNQTLMPFVTRQSANLFPGASLFGAHEKILPVHGQPGHPSSKLDSLGRGGRIQIKQK